MRLWDVPITGAIAVGLSALLHLAPAVTPAQITRLFFLDIRGGRVVSAAPDGSDVRVLPTGRKKDKSISRGLPQHCGFRKF